MKNLRCFWAKAIAYGVATVAVACVMTTQAAARQGTAKAQAIRGGSAEYTTDGSTWTKLKIGDIMKAGSIVRTDAGATVDFFLGANGPVLRVTPASTLDFNKLTFEKVESETVIETDLGLRNGRILGQYKRLAEASKYTVRTPNQVCAIKGTRFDISANGKVLVVEGTVIVNYTNAQGVEATFVVQPNQIFDPTANNGNGGVLAPPPAQFEEARRQINDAVSVITRGTITQVVVVAPQDPAKKQEEPTSKVTGHSETE